MPPRTEQNNNNLPSQLNDLINPAYVKRPYVSSQPPSHDIPPDPGSVYPSPELSHADTFSYGQASSYAAEALHENEISDKIGNSRKRGRSDDDLSSDIIPGKVEDERSRGNKAVRRDSGTEQTSHATIPPKQTSSDINSTIPIGTLKPLTKPKNFQRPLTCYFWANSCCTKSDDECWYAHYDTGFAAAAPVAFATGGASIAGRGAEKVLEVKEAQRMSLLERQAALKEQEEDLKSREEDVARREERLKRKHFVVNKLYEKTYDIVTDTIVYLETRQNRAYPCEVNLRGFHRPLHRQDRPIYNMINNTIDKLAGLEQRLDALKQ